MDFLQAYTEPAAKSFSARMTVEDFVAYLESRNRADVLALLDTLGLTREFVAKEVVSNAGTLTVAQTAMLWMGMPNKHDRKKTRQLFDALTEVGLLQPDAAGETWRSSAAEKM